VGVDKALKARVERMFKRSGLSVIYYSDVVKECGIDLRTAVEICDELIREGKIATIDGAHK